MTKTEIRSRIKVRLSEDGVFRTDSQIDESIDEASKYLTILARPFRKTGTATLDIGIPVASFPNDFFLPLRLSVSGSRLTPATPRLLTFLDDEWMVTVPGTPKYYFILSPLDRCDTSFYPNIYRNKFWVYPPNATASTVTIDYVYIPGSLGESSEPDLPKAYHGLYEDFGVCRSLSYERGKPALGKMSYLWEAFVSGVKELQANLKEQYRGTDMSPLPWDFMEGKLLVSGK